MKLITGSIAMIALLASPYSYATVITHGYLTTDDTTNYIMDTNTGRQYSRFDAFNLSYADTEAAIAAGSGHSFEGWSIATASVADDFYAASLGVSTTPCSGNVPGAPWCGNFDIAEWAEGDFGVSVDLGVDAFAYLTGVGSNPISLGAFTIDVGDPLEEDHVEVRDWESWDSIATLDALGGPSIPHRPLNLLLYKEASIPEPSTVALFGAALFGLGLVRRRRFQQ